MNRKLENYLFTLSIFLLMISVSVASDNDLDVNISNDISFVDVKHNGKEIRIQRNQSPDNLVNPEYAKTSRKCPPFCIQPYSLGNGVETIGELELIDYIKKSLVSNNSILVIDSRTEDWVKKGTKMSQIDLCFSSNKLTK